MNCNQLYLSTIDPGAGALARKYGLGVEIADYCTAMNMDESFEATDAALRDRLTGVSRRLFHGPFNELFPCAIDPLAKRLADYRYGQALALSKTYGAGKLILHGGYNPRMYYPCWYVEQSIIFWRSFLESHPGDYEICLENVLEEEPELLRSIVSQVGDPRLRLCLDVGHVNAYSEIPVMEWLESWSPYISHFHVHNNDGTRDQHSPLREGSIPMKELLAGIDELCPDATVTLELMEGKSSVQWLEEEEIWNC